MADIAAIFHWPHSDLLAMSVPELLSWHDRALTRYRQMNEVKK